MRHQVQPYEILHSTERAHFCVLEDIYKKKLCPYKTLSDWFLQ